VTEKIHQKLVILWHGFDVRALDRKEAEVRRQVERQAKEDGVELVWTERHASPAGISWRVQWSRHGVLLSETLFLQARVDQIYQKATGSIARTLGHSLWFGLRLLARPAWIGLAWRRANAGLIVALLPCLLAAPVLLSLLLMWASTSLLSTLGLAVAWAGLAWLFLRRASTRGHARLLIKALTFLNTSPSRYSDQVHSIGDSLIATALQTPFDEVVVAGHSIGAHFALIDALKWQTRLAQRPAPVRLSLVTMGQSISFSSAPGKGHLFKDMFQALDPAQCEGWYDFSSPADCITGLLPNRDLFWKISGMIPPHKPHWPSVIASPRFHAHIAPLRYQRIKSSRMKLHMQYIGHTNSPNGFNFTYLAFGPTPIQQWVHSIQGEQA
jgi:hypothetical protein